MGSSEATAEATAWREYLGWTRGARPWDYNWTEQAAWNRLQRKLLVVREPIALFEDLDIVYIPEPSAQGLLG